MIAHLVGWVFATAVLAGWAWLLLTLALVAADVIRNRNAGREWRQTRVRRDGGDPI